MQSRLSSDVTSKESTPHVVYDVAKDHSSYKASKSPECTRYLQQEILVSAYVHKSIYATSGEGETSSFLASLGQSGDIRKLTNVNVNKLHQPWRSFAAVINKCLSGTPSYDSLRLSSSDIVGNEATQLYGAILPVALTNEDIRNSESYKEYYAMASGTIPLRQKEARRKLIFDQPETKPPNCPQEKKICRRRQLRKDDEDDEQADDDDEHDDNKKAQDDDDEELTESDNDGDDFVHPKLTTHDDEIIHEEDTDEDDSRISSSDEEDSDNEVEGTNVEGAKTQEEATDTEDQGNEAVKDTNTDLDGRDKVMTNVEDTHVTLTPVNPDGQQQSSSVSSGFVSSMLNPNQDTGVDDIFRQHTEATSLIDTNVTAIMEPSFTAQINRPPTPHPIIIQPQQLPILTPATTTSSSLQNLPNFASLFGFDHRLKALEDNFSELRQTNQYAEALSSIPSTYERIREESSTANQQFLESIDDGMKKIIKEQVKKEVSKIIPKVEKFVTDQLESEVLVRSSKEANTSHAVAANRLVTSIQKDGSLLSQRLKLSNGMIISILTRLQYEGMMMVLYKFKEGDFHRLRIQDIEDMLLLLVQGKVTNLSVEERIAFNVLLTNVYTKCCHRDEWKSSDWC
ncbi:hypothetical protein Tco_0087560 [Tanacetum coccineum]